MLTIAMLVSGAGAVPASTSFNAYVATMTSAAPVAAIHTSFDAEPGVEVRLAIYDSEERFLETPRDKRFGLINDQGVAIVSLDHLEPGEYALAAYLDENGDGKLNRGRVLGRPKEPIAFSNGAKAKLRKPRFEEAKIALAPGRVVLITLDD